MAPATPGIRTAASFRETLPPAVKKALTDFWGSDTVLDEPDILAELGPANLGKIKRIGRISLGEIARCLERCGYIESSRQWLAAGDRLPDSRAP